MTYVKKETRHFIDGDSPEVGVQVEGEIDWTRRYSHMRMHTSQHLVSAVVNELYNSDTVGNQIGAENSRIDFKPLLSVNQKLNIYRKCKRLCFKRFEGKFSKS